jgi:hypothetical protein
MVVWNEIHLGVFKRRSFSNLQDGKVLPVRREEISLSCLYFKECIGIQMRTAR